MPGHTNIIKRTASSPHLGQTYSGRKPIQHGGAEQFNQERTSATNFLKKCSVTLSDDSVFECNVKQRETSNEVQALKWAANLVGQHIRGFESTGEKGMAPSLKNELDYKILAAKVFSIALNADKSAFESGFESFRHVAYTASNTGSEKDYVGALKKLQEFIGTKIDEFSRHSVSNVSLKRGVLEANVNTFDVGNNIDDSDNSLDAWLEPPKSSNGSAENRRKSDAFDDFSVDVEYYEVDGDDAAEASSSYAPIEDSNPDRIAGNSLARPQRQSVEPKTRDRDGDTDAENISKIQEGMTEIQNSESRIEEARLILASRGAQGTKVVRKNSSEKYEISKPVLCEKFNGDNPWVPPKNRSKKYIAGDAGKYAELFSQEINCKEPNRTLLANVSLLFKWAFEDLGGKSKRYSDQVNACAGWNLLLESEDPNETPSVRDLTAISGAIDRFAKQIAKAAERKPGRRGRVDESRQKSGGFFGKFLAPNKFASKDGNREPRSAEKKELISRENLSQNLLLKKSPALKDIERSGISGRVNFLRGLVEEEVKKGKVNVYLLANAKTLLVASYNNLGREIGIKSMRSHYASERDIFSKKADALIELIQDDSDVISKGALQEFLSLFQSNAEYVANEAAN
jgi:hypothetical protein